MIAERVKCISGFHGKSTVICVWLDCARNASVWAGRRATCTEHGLEDSRVRHGLDPAHKDNGNYSHWLTPTPDGCAAYNIQVFDLIFAAYELKSPSQLVGLPQWGYEDSFDLEAKLDEDAVALLEAFLFRRREQAAPMLRSMLADRFNLKVHHEMRQLPVYALVVAKGGSNWNSPRRPKTWEECSQAGA